MIDRCETCGWFSGQECRYQAPQPLTDSIGFARWRDVEPDDFCSNQTAVQRRRDRLMLAGQSLPLVGELPAIAAKAGLEATEEMLADYSLRIADAILKRAEEEGADQAMWRQRNALLTAAQKSVDELAKLYEGPGGFIATHSNPERPAAVRDVPAAVERLRKAIAVQEDSNAKS